MLASKIVPVDQKPSDGVKTVANAVGAAILISPNVMIPLPADATPAAPSSSDSLHVPNTTAPVALVAKAAYRTLHPLTISTQRAPPTNNGSNALSGSDLTPRSAGVRRKPVAIPPSLSTEPSSPAPISNITPATHTEKTKQQNGVDLDESGSNKSKREKDVIIPLDQSIAVPNDTSQCCHTTPDVCNDANCSNGKGNISVLSGSEVSLRSFTTNGSTKRKISFNRPGMFIKTMGRHAANSGASSRSSIRTGSPRPNSIHVSSNGSVGQKFGDFLGISGSLIGSKKRGSDTSMKARANSPAPSPSPSISSMSRDMSSSQIATPKTPSFLLTTLFGGGGESQSRQSQNLQSSAATPTRRDVRLWTAESLRDEDEDSKVESWELHQSVPSAGYDDESFGLWIRPNERTRTVISGEDAERTEMASNIQRSGRGDADSLNAECSSESELANRKMVCAEQEDMEILEEVLDFSIIILMRASAALYSFITGAHGKSTPISIPWRTLQYKERGYKLYNIKNLKEYQDFVMTDIGLAIQAMNEILDQQERTRGHPDNLGRDSKPHGGQKSSLPPLSPVILPPIKNHQNVTLKGSKSTRLPRRPNPQQVPQMLSIGQTTTPENPQQQHRRRSSVSQGRPTLSSMISSIKQSLPSPSILHSPHQRQYTSYPDGTPFPSTAVPVSVPVSYSQSESTDQQQQLYQMLAQSLNSGVNVNNGGFLPQSIQNIFSSFRGSPNSPNGSSLPGHVVSPRSAPPTLTKQEEKRLHMDHRWRVDILRRRAHLRGWACRNFLALYEYSIMISSSSPTLPLALACSLEQEFKDQYRIINAIVRVDAIATAKSHEMLEAILRKSHELEKEQFKLRYNAYRTKAPTGKEIRIMNLEAVKLFEEQYTTPGIKVRRGEQNQNETNGGAIELSLDEYVAPLALVAQHIDSTASASTAATAVVNDSAKESSDVGSVSAYDFMELYGLQGHSVWEPLLDRLTKFDTTHHSLDARNVYQFLRRMSVSSPSVTLNLLSDKARDELLAVLWILERCVSERKDFQQSPTWFRMSSSASAVQELYDAGGVISYMKNLRDNDAQGRDPINIVHPVTLTGYFKRLLKDCGGLLLKEATALFVELTSPSTDNGEFWTLDKLTKIDRALLYRLICLDLNRGRVFLRISRIMEQILESSPKDMELDAFALSKMVQVVELSGVLDLKALRRWNGAWSAIILGYM